MKSVKQHLHIGAGALGLGLICWLTHRAGFSVFLANRKYGSSDESLTRHNLLRDTLIYNVVYHDDITETVRLTGFTFFDEEVAQFADIVCHKDTLLITIAVRDPRALDAIVPVLCPALLRRARSGNPPVYIIACENAITSADLMASLNSHDSDFEAYSNFFISPECVVDRICNEPTIDYEKGLVSLRVERFANWLIGQQASQMLRLKDSLTPVMVECVCCVHDINLYKARKLWLLNGPHLLIAVYIYYQLSDDQLAYEDNDNIPFLLAATPGAGEVLKDILEEAAHMFERLYGPSGTPFKFARQVEMRFLREPDKLTRVLKDFTEPSKENHQALEKVLQKLYTRVVSLCMETHDNPIMINLVVGMLIQMISERRYLKSSDLTAPTIN